MHWNHQALREHNSSLPTNVSLAAIFIHLQNGVDVCETEWDTRGPRVHYVALFSRREWKITPLCLIRKSLPLTSWSCSVTIKDPEVCEVSPHPPCFVAAVEPKQDSLRKKKSFVNKCFDPTRPSLLIEPWLLKGYDFPSSNILYFLYFCPSLTITALQFLGAWCNKDFFHVTKELCCLNYSSYHLRCVPVTSLRGLSGIRLHTSVNTEAADVFSFAVDHTQLFPFTHRACCHWAVNWSCVVCVGK